MPTDAELKAYNYEKISIELDRGQWMTLVATALEAYKLDLLRKSLREHGDDTDKKVLDRAQRGLENILVKISNESGMTDLLASIQENKDAGL